MEKEKGSTIWGLGLGFPKIGGTIEGLGFGGRKKGFRGYVVFRV